LSSSWIQSARRDLVALCGQSGAWGYRIGHPPSVEPTALACLGLLASAPAAVSAVELEIAQKAADWMQVIQQPDGSLRVSKASTSPGWATPYGLLLWSNCTGEEDAKARACAWLLGNEGEQLDQFNQTDRLVGHDASLVGWPWVIGTHSWLEPTAMAILALRRAGLYDHPRIKAGTKLILDRALNAGGWNYGNKAVFGTELRPQPGPTGLALLALASLGKKTRAVAAALEYLRQALTEIQAPVSLGWGVLALRAHKVCPTEAEMWLARSYLRTSGKPDAAMGLALLLLASSERALDLVIRPI